MLILWFFKALRDEGKDPDTYVFEERAKRLSIDKQSKCRCVFCRWITFLNNNVLVLIVEEETEPEITTPVENATKESPKDGSTKEGSKENDSDNQVKSTVSKKYHIGYFTFEWNIFRDIA